MNGFASKKIKRTASLIMLIVICFAYGMSAAAIFESASLTDNAGFLTDDEFDEVAQRLSKIRNRYDMDVAVYTEAEMSGKTAQDTADDIFDYEGYGYGPDRDGIIFYVSESPRKYHFSTHGEAITVFNNAGLEYIESECLPYLQDDDYYGAFIAYCSCTDELLEMAANGEVYTGGTDDDGNFIIIIAALIIPLIVAAIATLIQRGKMKTAVNENYAANYVKKNGIKIKRSQDIFLYSTITQTKREKESDSDTHTSSSGSTHGGTGGDY